MHNVRKKIKENFRGRVVVPLPMQTLLAPSAFVFTLSYRLFSTFHRLWCTSPTH